MKNLENQIVHETNIMVQEISADYFSIPLIVGGVPIKKIGIRNGYLVVADSVNGNRNFFDPQYYLESTEIFLSEVNQIP